jgi:uncharacterized protein
VIIVSNTTPLIGLASIKHFELLHQIFHKIYIPSAVYNEVVVTGREFGGAKKEVQTAKWIETLSIKDHLAVEVLLDDLDLGEAETIVLARELNADWVLMDEKKGRRKVTQLGLNKIGTMGILLKAKEMGFLTVIRPELEKLRRQGFSISQKVLEVVLEQANE